MDITLEELGIFGRVRFMALPAINYRRFYIDVRLGKRLRLEIMTFTAERLKLLGKQGRLLGEMRLMALQAISGRG